MMRIWILALLGVLAWSFFSRAYFVRKFCPTCSATFPSALTDTLAELPNSQLSPLPEAPLNISTERMVEQGETFRFDQMNFSDTSSDSSSQAGDFHLSPQFIVYADSLTAYCAQFPAAKITLTGYTNIDDQQTSKNFAALNWLNTVKGYLTAKGLDENRITVVSKLIKEGRISDATGKAVKKRLQVTIQRAG